MELPLIDEKTIAIPSIQRSYSPEEVTMIQAEIQKLVAAGVVQRSTSPWAAGLVLVRKKDGTVRLCQDYRRMNQRLVSNSCGLGDITTIHSQMTNSGCITSIDLATGFNQIVIAPQDRPKTTFRDARGELWKMVRCGFGLKTLPAAFAGSRQDGPSTFSRQNRSDPEHAARPNGRAVESSCRSFWFSSSFCTTLQHCRCSSHRSAPQARIFVKTCSQTTSTMGSGPGRSVVATDPLLDIAAYPSLAKMG